jgi:hypothetical protein
LQDRQSSLKAANGALSKLAYIGLPMIGCGYIWLKLFTSKLYLEVYFTMILRKNEAVVVNL